jgi:UDP-glucose 4-epimerase
LKKILITGANSYIGDSVREYLINKPEDYSVDIKDTINWNPQKVDFEGYDVVFNVAGIAHRKETSENRQLYYDINRDLVIKIAKEAKEAGVKQFILLSTMSVYGMLTGYITKDTPTNPTNAYGKSKAEADEEIAKLADGSFKFACLRPPMVYGNGCKGNYQSLRKLALLSPVFPKYNNERSMIYIGNLCEFVKNIIDSQSGGLFFPQNSVYTNTSEMVCLITKFHDKKIILTPIFNWLIKIIPGNIIKKVFGSLVYESVDTVDKYGFKESIRLTEIDN